VNEEMLGWKASQIMASLRSNGWTMTGKLRRDQPDIFAPEDG
jgi:lambda repressor-like predicted transcriptional regulator